MSANAHSADASDRLLLSQAIMRAVKPSEEVKSLFAPFSHRYFVTFVRPNLAANISAVQASVERWGGSPCALTLQVQMSARRVSIDK